MRHKKNKQFLLLLSFVFSIVWCKANNLFFNDGSNVICIQTTQTQGEPRTSSIQASIDGHCLSIVFLENLGQVSIVITMVSGGEIQSRATPTPYGVDFFISNTGSYIVTFTLTNGDEYYGEFEVTD